MADYSQLQHLSGFTAEDFGVSDEVFQEMQVCEALGLSVTVDCKAEAGGTFGYWDITLPMSGAGVSAIDGYHLNAKCDE